MDILSGPLLLVLLVIPVIAIVALVRSGRTRKLLDGAIREYRDKISELKGEIAGLRRELNEVSQRAGQPGAVSSPAPIAEAKQVKAAPEPVAAPETARPMAQPYIVMPWGSWCYGFPRIRRLISSIMA